MSAKLPPEVTKPFVHLHCHTHYSLLDGANRIPELCSHVKALGMDAVAVTDHGNLYGAIELFREAEAAGIKPIVGYEAYVAPGKRHGEGQQGKWRRVQLPPHDARPQHQGLQEPHQAGVDGLPRRLLLQAPHRQGDARSPQRRHHLSLGMHVERVQQSAPQ